MGPGHGEFKPRPLAQAAWEILPSIPQREGNKNESAEDPPPLIRCLDVHPYILGLILK
jgi:hypothetical protein